MLRAILKKSWWHHPTRHQLYCHLPSITKTIQVRWNRHAGHCWRSRDKLISDVLLCTPTYGRAKAGRPARTYIQQLCEDMECSPEDLPEAKNDREKWRERISDIRASSTTWWWWLYIKNNVKKKMLKIFLYCLILFFCILSYNTKDRNTWNLIINQITIWCIFDNCPWHIAKISCWLLTSDSLRSTKLGNNFFSSC